MKTASELRIDISSQIAYLQLCASIMKNIPENKFVTQVKQTILMIQDFLSDANDKAILEKGPAVLDLLSPIIKTVIEIYPPKRSIYEIAVSYNDYCRNNPGALKELGYQYGWLRQQIDCRRLYAQPVPAHAKVGTFYNAGKFIIEEGIILRDAFYFVVLAEREFERLDALAEKYKDGIEEAGRDDLNQAGILNANVGTFCRMGLLNFYSFIEAYVNGIGLNHLFLNESSLSEREKELLEGKDGKQYLSLEKKLETFHRIIRSDKKTVFVTTSKAQLKEPFVTFFEECKTIRNATVHYAPTKEPIVRKPHEWMEKVVTYGKNTMEVAKKFWEACDNSKNYPDYLDLLDFGILKDLAIKRYNSDAH